MLKWAFIFLLIAIVAGVLGFTPIAGAAMGVAQVLFFFAFVIFLALLILGVTIFRTVRGD